MGNNRIDFTNSLYKNNTKPNCNRCNHNGHVELIDVLFDPGDNRGTTPMWRCDSCAYSWTGRTYDVDNTIGLSSQQPINNYPAWEMQQMATRLMTNSNPIENPNFTQAVNVVVRTTEQILRMDMDNRFKNVEERLRRAEDLASDPMTPLRKSVFGFNLK